MADYLRRRPESPWLRSNQKTDLMALPHMHLTRLLEGHLDADYLATLAGLFNIAAALANRRRLQDLEVAIDAAQQIVLQLMADFRVPSEAEGVDLQAAVVLADRLICRQSKKDLAEAIAYVDRRIAAGRTVTCPNQPGPNA